VAVIEWCVDRGCDIYIKDAHGRSAVSKACWRGHIGTVKMLVDNYRFPPRSIKTYYDDTMLHDCAYSGRVDVFAWLHRTYQLDLESVNELGEVPFHGACACGNIDLCKYMLEHAVDPGLLGYESRNAAHYAAAGGFIDILELLHEHCPEVDFLAVDRLGKSVLWVAMNENADQAQARKTVVALKKILPETYMEEQNRIMATEVED
jgi:ankyrin repeat protein